MAAENAQKVLDVFSHFGTRAGGFLVADHFLGIGRLREWPTNDLQQGIDEARRNGWVERTERGWRLTDAGFDRLVKPAS